MAKPPAKNPKKTHRAEPREAADLRLQLADRDRQLAELTEHSLRILDELAVARQQPASQAALQQRVAALEGALADARARMRTGSRALLAPGVQDAGAATFDVVLWGFGAEPTKQVAGSTAELAFEATTVLMGRQHRAESFVEAARAGWTVLESSCARPAHYWNEAMAATTRDVVVFLVAGTAMAAEDVRRLAEAARCVGVAASSPMLTCGGDSTMGRSEQGILEIRPMPFSAEVASALRPFASPEAFALSRAVFEAVGPFDQDLSTEVALAEWVMRAAGQSLRVVGVADAKARATAPLVAESAAVAESDRLTVLARHRPHQLMVAALASEALWQADADSVGTTLRAVMQRLPRAQEFKAAIDILVHQAQTVASYKRIAPVMRERIAALCSELQLPPDALSTDSAWPSLIERATSVIASMRQQASSAESARQDAERARRERDASAERFAAAERELKDGMLARSGTIDSLRNELLERERAIASLRQEVGHRQGEAQRCIDHLAEQQQLILDLQEQAGRDALERERLADIESRWQASTALVQQLQAALAEATRAAADVDARHAERYGVELRELRERTAAEIGALQRRAAELESLRSHSAAREAAARQDNQRDAQALESALQRASAAEERADVAEAAAQAAAARAIGLEARIRAAEARVIELEDSLEEAKVAIAQEQTLAAARSERQDEALRRVETRETAASAKAARLEDELEASGAKNAGLGRKLEQLESALSSLRQQLAAAQQETRNVDAKRNAAVGRAEDALRVLEEREAWIGLLLQEVRQRRWAPRDLLQHEKEFLARRDERQKP